MPHVLTDGEFTGTPLAANDLPLLALLFSNEEVGRTLGGTRSHDETVAIFARWRDLWDEHGFGPFLFRDADGNFVGYSGLAPAPIGEPGDVELMYASLPSYWGRGVVTRISRLVVDWFFREGSADSLVAYTLTTNHASMGVMKKLGFVYERDIEKSGLPHVMYRLARSRWQA